jgi:hypothetical protein
MKKKIIYAACFCLIVLLAPACSKTCKTCKQVFYTTGSSTVDHSGTDAEYCGVDLVTIENMGTVSIGGYDAKWECR